MRRLRLRQDPPRGRTLLHPQEQEARTEEPLLSSRSAPSRLASRPDWTPAGSMPTERRILPWRPVPSREAHAADTPARRDRPPPRTRPRDPGSRGELQTADSGTGRKPTLRRGRRSAPRFLPKALLTAPSEVFCWSAESLPHDPDPPLGPDTRPAMLYPGGRDPKAHAY